MNVKLTVDRVELCSFIVDLIQHITGVCIYKVLGRC